MQKAAHGGSRGGGSAGGSRIRGMAACAALGAGLAVGQPARAEPLELEHGFWSENYRTFNYYVDTTTRLCFVTHSLPKRLAMAQIPCESLARRPEWRPVLTWIRPEPDGPEGGVER